MQAISKAAVRATNSAAPRIVYFRMSGCRLLSIASDTSSVRLLRALPATESSLGNVSASLKRSGRRSLHSRSRGGSKRSSSASTTSSGKKGKKAIHMSAAAPHSASATAAPHFIQPPPAEASSIATSVAKASSELRPTVSQLRTLFVSSSVPMVGFGFMDNFIMIQAGGYIDATLGVKMGLATLTAAAMGQVVSDVSGVVFGGTLERTLNRLGLIKPSNLSSAQRLLPICRNVSMFGAVLGVMTGCALGATSLLFLDLDSAERKKRAAGLERVLTTILKEDGEDGDMMGCDGCTIYMGEASHYTAGSATTEDAEAPQVLPLHDVRPDSHVARCARTGVLMIDNYAEDVRDDLKVKSVLCAPVLTKEGGVVAVVEFRNKKADGDGSSGHFTEQDERVAKMLARHVGIFMDQMGSS